MHYVHALVLSLFLYCFTALPSHAQNSLTHGHYDKNYFRSPLDIPLKLAGTFGELRTNHFHAGIDCKTGGQENLNIYAVADGYVSRIKISPTGYGNALYIDHPNGYTSVYAHLKKFTGAIGQWVENYQYQNQTFAFDAQIPIGELQVTKGLVVAKSGNTGSSGGPHLHFEIRDTFTEEALNPLLFGLQVTDNVKPSLRQLAIYPFERPDDRHSKAKIYPIKYEGGKYKTTTNHIKVNTSRVGIGLKTYDKQTGIHHLNGIYSLKMLDNGNSVYAFAMERIGFEESRYINCHVDYTHKANGGGLMQRCFLEPGNRLNIYRDLFNRGVIDLSDGLLHKITFEVQDIAGNISTLSFMLQYDPNLPAPQPEEEAYSNFFYYAADNSFNHENLTMFMPYGSLYNDLPFSYSASPSTTKGVYSDYYQLHNSKTPVHKYFDVAIRPTNLPNYLRDKALIAYKTRSGKTKSAGGVWEGDYLKGQAKEFGTFFITVDTIAPTIKPVTITNGKNMSKNQTITLTINDNLSGIKSYDGYIDGQWILMSYDKKTARLRYWFDERASKGKHEFTLVVTDESNNTKTFKANFVR